MRMLCDYAHERWAASASCEPGAVALRWPIMRTGRDLADLERVLENGTEPERSAAALALASCPDPTAGRIASARPAICSVVAGGKVTWDSIVQTGAEKAMHEEKTSCDLSIRTST